MTRRVKRQRDFELTLDLRNPGFIRPPREAQRNWLLNRAMAEFTTDLQALDALSMHFVSGGEPAPIGDREHSDLDDGDIMEDWQIPIMQAMAHAVTASHGDVLEIGFGRGIAAEMIQLEGVASHTVIECNEPIMQRFERWRALHPSADIHLAPGRWQDVLGDLPQFDGIFFHTYPLNEDEFVEQIGDATTFAAHFFPYAARHLREGGTFTYLSNEMDSVGRPHQRALFEHFAQISLSRIAPLDLPHDVRDAWWADTMMLVTAVR